MRSLHIKLIALAVMMTVSLASFSQIGIRGGFNMGVLTDNPKSSNIDRAYPGFFLGVNYSFSDNFRANVTFEGMFNKVKNSTFTNRVLPVTFGVDYSFLPHSSFQPYIGFNLGSYSIGTGGKVNALNTNLKTGNTYFGLNPRLGADYYFNDNLSLVIEAKYHVAFLGKLEFN